MKMNLKGKKIEEEKYVESFQSFMNLMKIHENFFILEDVEKYLQNTLE